MPATRVSATTAKNQLGTLLERAEEGTPVIIENRREPVAVLISIDEYQELQALRKEQRRQRALRIMRELAEEQSKRNSDLTEDQANELVDRYMAETRAERRQQLRDLVLLREE